MSAIGSGTLDVNALVQNLVAAERAPHSLRFNRAEAGAKAKLSAFATLTSAFDKLKTAVDALKASTSFTGRIAKSSDETIFSASADSTVAVGSYAIEVIEIASAHKLTSAARSASTDLGAGQLSFTVGSVSFAASIVADQSTPSEIATAINAAATTAGAKLNVTVVNSDAGQSLVFNGTETGATNSITITNTSSPANAALDVYINANLTQNTAAQNAQVKVDGLLTTSSSNTVTGAVPGLTLQLIAKAPGSPKTLTVSIDNSAGKSLVQNVVSAYNGAITAVANATKYDAATKTASTLTGDASARGAGNQLRSALGDALKAFSDAGLDSGISTKTDGTLSFDGAKFDTALATNASRFTQLLSGSDGLGARLSAVSAAFVGNDGIFKERTEGLNKLLTGIATDREATERRLAMIEARYRAQFSALDSLLGKLQGTSNFLAQQLANLPGSQ